MENSQEQRKKQYDWIKGYQFVKGQSGNPGGRPKGAKSMKTWAREYLESLPDDERITFMESLDPDFVWRMAEGNPKQDTGLTDKDGNDIAKPILDVLFNNNSNRQGSETTPTN